MRYNEKISIEYGESNIPSTLPPVPYKPLPVNDNYANGYIDRTFAKKVNENVIVEIDYGSSRSLNQDLYVIITVTWKISGPRTNKYKDSLLIESGVETQNKFEIDRVKKEIGIDLSKALPDLLEYWRGY